MGSSEEYGSDAEFDAMLRNADPARDAALPDPEGPEALRIRTRAHLRSRQSKVRRLVVIPAATALVVGGATAGAMAVFGNGEVSHIGTVECYSDSGLQGTVMSYNPTSYGPERACGEMGDLPEGDQLTACAPVDGRGAIRVYEGGEEVCAEHDLVLYSGPTDEQLRLGDISNALYALEMDPHACPSLTETQALLRDVLDEHGLNDWRVVEGTAKDYPSGHGQTLGTYAGLESCPQQVTFVEPEQLLVLDMGA
ncbi:hypothetical protein [Streptomyces marincola]|uniref:hypothetical protein n=1 Tax=Streptomyces marincola TaxID=2878388 RepID=UPI001CF28F4C|nr:hypothetical protein [Streptomyces marincola]UCM89255.1 hypothetical protein LC193_15595 [Streptomyces marincola]